MKKLMKVALKIAGSAVLLAGSVLVQQICKNKLNEVSNEAIADMSKVPVLDKVVGKPKRVTTKKN